MTQKSIVHNPFKIVRMFEEELENYTGAPYAVAVDSCTNGLFLCCKYLSVKEVTIPSKTYLSVPMAIMHASGEVILDTSEEANSWCGAYPLRPYPIYDCAKRLTSNMFNMSGGDEKKFLVLSFHIKKNLAIGKGGMILTNDKDAVEWLKKMRYEGRGEIDYKKDSVNLLGFNFYMTPVEAAHGLSLLLNYPEHMPDQIEVGGYRDLTTFPVFKNCKRI